MPKVALITALLANNIFFSNIAVAETDKPKFYASSAEARNLAKDMGIDSYVTYPEQGDMAVFTTTLNVDEGVSVPRDKVVVTHQIIADQYKQLGEMGIFPRKPDTVHLHIDFIDGNDNRFQLLSKKLAAKARASGLLLESLGLEFLDDKYIHRYSPHVLPKSYQIHLKINPDMSAVMEQFLLDATEMYLEAKLDQTDSCLYFHSYHAEDPKSDSDPVDQYPYLNKELIFLVPNSVCGYSHSYAENMVERLNQRISSEIEE